MLILISGVNLQLAHKSTIHLALKKRVVEGACFESGEKLFAGIFNKTVDPQNVSVAYVLDVQLELQKTNDAVMTD